MAGFDRVARFSLLSVSREDLAGTSQASVRDALAGELDAGGGPGLHS